MSYFKTKNSGTRGDKFTSVMSDFLSVATYNFSELEDQQKDMKDRVSIKTYVNMFDILDYYLICHYTFKLSWLILRLCLIFQYEKVLKAYGEECQRVQPDEFFLIFDTFLTSFSEARVDNLRIKKQQEEEERRARLEQQLKEEKRKQKNSLGVRKGSSSSRKGGSVTEEEEKGNATLTPVLYINLTIASKF